MTKGTLSLAEVAFLVRQSSLQDRDAEILSGRVTTTRLPQEDDFALLSGIDGWYYDTLLILKVNGRYVERGPRFPMAQALTEVVAGIHRAYLTNGRPAHWVESAVEEAIDTIEEFYTAVKQGTKPDRYFFSKFFPQREATGLHLDTFAFCVANVHRDVDDRMSATTMHRQVTLFA